MVRMFCRAVLASVPDVELDVELVVELDEDVDEEFSSSVSRACRVLTTMSWELLPSTRDVADVESSEEGSEDILSWMLAKIFWASVILPDCKALERLCRSLLNGSSLEPPFWAETSFCRAVNAVSASDTLPDWRAVASVLKSSPRVFVLDDEVESEGGAWGPDDNLSWMLAKMLWASVVLPDCRALERLCRSLLNGSSLEPPFWDATVFCRVDNALSASVVSPDCRSLAIVAMRLEMLEVVLSVDVLSEGGGGGGP